MKPESCLVLLIASILLLTGCQGLTDPDSVAAFIAPAAEPPPTPAAATPGREAVLARYEAAARVDDSLATRRRLAALQLKLAEDALVAGEAVNWDQVTGRLAAAAGGDVESEILRTRQLAYAADLAANEAHLYAHLFSLVVQDPSDLEARFRLAELLFVRGDYAGAATHYERVAGAPGEYRTHANYMLGWTRLKLNDPGAAQVALLPVLAQLYPAPALTNGEAELLLDTERAMRLATESAGGVASLPAVFAAAGDPDWQHAWYASLAASYLGQERYSDSITALRTFVDGFPDHEAAATLSLQEIDTLAAAGFRADLIQARRDFVIRYDRLSRFYAMHGEAAFAGYAEPLESYLDTWTSRVHATAQSAGDPAAYLEAAGLHERWIVNFPDHQNTASHRRLRAEAYQDAGATVEAIAAWQAFVFAHPSDPDVADARYAIVLLQEAGGSPEAQLVAVQDFILSHPFDERTPALQLRGADLLFALQEYTAAVALADALLASGRAGQWQAAALLVSGHGYFELADYAPAEARFTALLDDWDAANDLPVTGDEIREKRLVSVYQQGRMAEDAGELAVAIDHYERLGRLAPGHELAIDARYDVIALHETLAQPGIAANKLETFRMDHPARVDALATSLRLVALYEQVDPGKAVQELARIAADETVASETRRVSLYQAATLALAADAVADAISLFRDYAHGYPEPVALRMEAMQHMDELYVRTAEPTKRAYWLRKKAALLSEDLDARTYTLAVNAHFELGMLARQQFDAVAITTPVATSLKKKQAHMTAALGYFETVAASGAEGLNAAGTFQIAELYAELAAALLDAPMPSGLNELEREQYVILLEEQAYPFEEQAIALHEVNLARGWQGEWDIWVDRSQQALAALSPGYYQRDEMLTGMAHALF